MNRTILWQNSNLAFFQIQLFVQRAVIEEVDSKISNWRNALKNNKHTVCLISQIVSPSATVGVEIHCLYLKS